MNKNIIRMLLLCLTFSLMACVSEEEPNPMGEGGRLQLSLANINTATTRSTPGDIGAPSIADFHLLIVNAAGRAVYNDVFTEEEITLPVGRYDVSVTYGRDNLLAIDAPYYIGTDNVEIVKDQTTESSITARVGNALVSANFGRDAEEQARFDRYYSDYALYVCVGNYSMAITKGEPARSVYVKSGNHVTLRFWGKLKMEDDREVNCELTSEDFPDTLKAADHAVVTLSLPDPESALGVDISKVEVETVTMDETIPLSWLPVAMVIPMHQFDRNGLLVGTNLIITESYPGKKWRTVITNAAGATVRAVEGTGALLSEYNADANKDTWPYLPHGNYKASYYFVEDDGTATFVSDRDFTIDAPQNLKVTVTGYTSYSMYLTGDINGANACDRLTIYEPSVSVNVSDALLRGDKWTHTFTYTYDGETSNVTTGNTYEFGDMAGQTVRSAAHVLRGDLTFDGVSVSAQKEFIITGLPYSLNLASHEEWISSSGVDWFDSDVRLGHLSTGSQSITNSSSVSIPMGTCFCADYSVNVHTLTVGTTFSVSVGNREILSIEEAGTPFRDTDHLHSGTTNVLKDDNQVLTTITCHNSYGAGQTCSHIYSLSFKYAKP